MFDFLFGWRKASKCKNLIKIAQCRLQMLKNKRQSIVRQLREDVAQLIKIGYEDIAFKRAEHLFEDETVVELYELLDNFCGFIIANLSYIRRNKDCPNDINEAVSSLIFASARCGDLPQLLPIRKLFSERYGPRFEATALELLPGNLVNFQVKEKLSIKSVPDDLKLKLFDEIVKDYCLQPEVLAIEFASEIHQQIAGSPKPENANEDSHQDGTFSTTISFSVAEQCSSDVMESQVDSFEAVCSQMTGRSGVSNSDRKTEASSSESLPQLQDEMIVYLDDIEEVKHCTEREGSFQDQRVFKFKSPVKLRKDTKGEHRDIFESNYDSWSDSDSSRKRVVKVAKRRTRRRSMSRENLTIKDMHCVIYYDKSLKNAEKRRKQRNSGQGLERKTEQNFVRESDTEMELYTFPAGFRRRRGSCDLGNIAYQRSKNKEHKINGSHSHIAADDSKAEKPPYLRAKTMPQEQSKERHSNNVHRSISFPIASQNHVHPKLPDYDEIAAKFMALKKEHKQNRHS